MNDKVLRFIFIIIIFISLFRYFNSFEERFDKRYVNLIQSLNTGTLNHSHVKSYMDDYPYMGEIGVIDLLAEISIKSDVAVIKDKINNIYPYVKYSRNFQHLTLNYFFLNGTEDDLKKIYLDIYRACTVSTRVNNIYSVSESDIRYTDENKYIYIKDKNLHINNKLFKELTYVSSGLYKIEIPKSTIEYLTSESALGLGNFSYSKESMTMVCFLNKLNTFSMPLKVVVIN